MSNLLNTPSGTLALAEATLDILRMRIRRWFERNTVIGFENWVLAGKPAFTADDALGILDALNEEHDTEISNLLDCLRQVARAETEIDLDWYVDVANGDDIEGDGSISNPYQSIARVQRIYGPQPYINSKVNIFLSAGPHNPETTLEDWKITFGPLGQLTIQGVQNPIGLSGPHTVQAGGWVNLGVSSVMGHEISVAAPAWVPGAMVGAFIHVLDGAQAGKFYAIAENTDVELYIANTDAPFAAGDSFEIVTPGTFIDSATIRTMHVYGVQQYELNYAARLIFTNCKIKDNMQFIFQNCGIDFGFCFTSAQFKFPNCECGYINLQNPLDPTQIIEPNYIDGNCPLAYIKTISVEGLNWCNCRRLTWDNFTQGRGIFNIDRCAGKHAGSFGNMLTINTYLAVTTAAQCFDYAERIDIHATWIRGCVDIIRTVTFNAEVLMYNIEGGVGAATGYTVRASQLSRILVTVANVLVGATNAVRWDSTGAAAAFPVAGASITDGNGAFVVGN